MAKTVEFLFDVGSPNAYLAYTQMPDLAKRTGAEIVWTPMLLGGVFKATGNRSPAEIPAKGAYMQTDMARFVKRYGIPFVRNPDFPINTLGLMRAITGAQMHGRLEPLLGATFHAMWVEPRNLNDPPEVMAMLKDGGFDAAEVRGWTEDQPVKDRLRENTESAVARGVFGAPSFFVDGELFFGQDRLDFVEAALRA